MTPALNELVPLTNSCVGPPPLSRGFLNGAGGGEYSINLIDHSPADPQRVNAIHLIDKAPGISQASGRRVCSVGLYVQRYLFSRPRVLCFSVGGKRRQSSEGEEAKRRKSRPTWKNCRSALSTPWRSFFSYTRPRKIADFIVSLKAIMKHWKWAAFVFSA